MTAPHSSSKQPQEHVSVLAIGQAEDLLSIYQRVLPETVIKGDYAKALDLLCQTAEQRVIDAKVIVSIYDQHQATLRVVAAPGLSKQAVNIVNRLSLEQYPGYEVINKKQPSYIEQFDQATHWREGGEDWPAIQACWSHPVMGEFGQCLGVVSVMIQTAGAPNCYQQRLLAIVSSIAGVIFEQESHISDLRRQADHDLLTGASNRRRFESDAVLLLKRARRYQERLAVIFIDIDNFKYINDEYGHDVGDGTLKYIATNLQEQLRGDDLVCRWGGDEFILLLVCESDCYLSVDTVNKRVQQCMKKPFKMDNVAVSIKMSCGVSLFPSDADDLSALIASADQAMLKAKAKGKNQLIFYQDLFPH